MARRSETERETIRISADAASRLLPKFHEQRAQLDDRIAKLQAVVDAWEAISGKRFRVEATQGQGEADPVMRTRVRKGQVPEHIDKVLQEGGEYDEPELRKAIKDKFGETYGRATVYTSLRRGLKNQKYVQNGKKWSLNPLRVAQKF